MFYQISIDMHTIGHALNYKEANVAATVVRAGPYRIWKAAA